MTWAYASTSTALLNAWLKAYPPKSHLYLLFPDDRATISCENMFCLEFWIIKNKESGVKSWSIFWLSLRYWNEVVDIISKFLPVYRARRASEKRSLSYELNWL